MAAIKPLNPFASIVIMNLEEIISIIVESKSMKREDVEKLIEEKQAELSYLISPEGAAYLVAKELGLDIIPAASTRLKIGNIISGMRNVNFVGKITRISDVVEFDKKDGKGRVRNIYLADESGRIRLTLWDDEVELADRFSEGDVVKVTGYSRDNNGEVEIRLGRMGGIIKVDEVIENVKSGREFERKDIRELRPGQYAELKAAIVQVFQTNPILKQCPECRKSLKEENGKYICPEHGEVEPALGVFLSMVIDDGTGNIRATAFGKAAETILGMTAEEAYNMATERMDKTAPLKAIQLGKEWIFRGSARRNELFDRLEFRIFNAGKVDVEKEIERLMAWKK